MLLLLHFVIHFSLFVCFAKCPSNASVRTANRRTLYGLSYANLWPLVNAIRHEVQAGRLCGGKCQHSAWCHQSVYTGGECLGNQHCKRRTGRTIFSKVPKPNNNVINDWTALYYTGRVTDHIGSYLQLNLNPASHQSSQPGHGRHPLRQPRPL